MQATKRQAWYTFLAWCRRFVLSMIAKISTLQSVYFTLRYVGMQVDTARALYVHLHPTAVFSQL